MFRVIYIVSTFEFSAPATNTKIKNRFTATYLKQSITQRPYILFLPTGLRSSVNAARSGSDTRFEWSAHSMMIHYIQPFPSHNHGQSPAENSKD